MEKRILLAFVISFFILYLWGMFFPAPRVQKNQPKITQTIENKEVDEEAPAYSAALPLPPQLDEKAITLTNDEIVVEISNLGGIIKNIVYKRHDANLPVTKILGASGHDQVVFQILSSTARRAVLSARVAGVVVTKEFELKENGKIINAKIIYENQNGHYFRLDNNEYVELEMSNLKKDVNHDQSLLEYSISLKDRIFRKGNAVNFSIKENKEEAEPINWIGFRDRYFCFILKPLYENLGYKFYVESDKKARISIKKGDLNLAPKEKATYEYVMYMGPQKKGILKGYGHGFEQIMAFSNWGIFDFVAKIIYNLLYFIHKFVPNWGLCIIIISLVIYGAMYPLTLSGMYSMKRMQQLQPEINKLKEKYKGNPQELNKKLVELYKEYKINPLSGCLPFILQMPVFIGLYQVLWRSVSFKGASFLWIKDLSEPDRLAILPFVLPFLGNEFNVLPILMMIIMFFQQKISMRNMVALDEAQVMQQKMMITIFPLMIGFLFYKFASGLSLYFTIFYLMSTLTQLKMSKLTKV